MLIISNEHDDSDNAARTPLNGGYKSKIRVPSPCRCYYALLPLSPSVALSFLGLMKIDRVLMLRPSPHKLFSACIRLLCMSDHQMLDVKR